MKAESVSIILEKELFIKPSTCDVSDIDAVLRSFDSEIVNFKFSERTDPANGANAPATIRRIRDPRNNYTSNSYVSFESHISPLFSIIGTSS